MATHTVRCFVAGDYLRKIVHAFFLFKKVLLFVFTQMVSHAFGVGTG